MLASVSADGQVRLSSCFPGLSRMAVRSDQVGFNADGVQISCLSPWNCEKPTCSIWTAPLWNNRCVCFQAGNQTLTLCCLSPRSGISAGLPRHLLLQNWQYVPAIWKGCEEGTHPGCSCHEPPHQYASGAQKAMSNCCHSCMADAEPEYAADLPVGAGLSRELERLRS